MAQTDAERWHAKIQLAYDTRVRLYPEASLGWRFLYSLVRVLSGARVAFIGLNPGGRSIDTAHGEFSSEKGSAYRKEIEDWGSSRSLQDQVIALFNRLNVSPEEVLAGNLVPFRSPDAQSLSGALEAIAFGRSQWSEILEKLQPSIVVSMGGTTNREISRLLKVGKTVRHPVGWANYTASRGEFAGGTWVGLPHLSRFSIMKRRASQSALNDVFKGLS